MNSSPFLEKSQEQSDRWQPDRSDQLPRMGDGVFYWYEGLQGKIDDQLWPRTQRPVMLGRVPGEEVVSIDQAAGRVLAQDVHARLPVPNRPLSRLYGCAVRSADLAKASAVRAVRINPEALFDETDWRGDPDGGEVLQPPKKGALAVSRGALLPMPYDTDAVLHDLSEFYEGEDMRKKRHRRVNRPVPAGWDVIPQGSQLQPGELLLHRGQRLTEQALGMLGMAGISKVQVFARPRIAVLTFYHLLRAPDGDTAGSWLPDGGTPQVLRLLRRWGYEPDEVQIIKRDRGGDQKIALPEVQSVVDRFDFTFVLLASSPGNIGGVRGFYGFSGAGVFAVDPKVQDAPEFGAFPHVHIYGSALKPLNGFSIGCRRDPPASPSDTQKAHFFAQIGAGSSFNVTCAMYMQVRAVLDALSGVGAYSFSGYRQEAYKDNGHDWRVLGADCLPRQTHLSISRRAGKRVVEDRASGKPLAPEPMPDALKTLLEGSSKERWRHHGIRWFTGVLLNPAPRDPERHWLQLAQLESQDDGRMGVRVLPTEEYQVRHLNEAEAICLIDKASSPEETEFPPGTVVYYFLLD